MKILYLLILIAHAKANVINQQCDGVIIRNINYQKEILKNGILRPYHLAIDYHTHTLFFSFSVENDSSALESGYLNLKTNEFGVIDGINSGFANGVDQEANIVYLGGEDGLYKFDYGNKKAVHIDGTSDNIWQMFFKKYLYYTTFPKEHVYVYKNNQSQRVPQFINSEGTLVALDNNYNIYIYNDTGLFVYENNKDNILSLGDYNINGITTDMNGNIYFSTPKSIYSIDSETKIVEKLVKLDKNHEIHGMAIDSDGSIIYALKNSINRLQPTQTKCDLY